MNIAQEQKHLIKFFLLTYLISWLLWFPAVLGREDIFPSNYSHLLVVLGGFVPSLVGLGLTFLYNNKISGLKALGRRALQVRFAPKWYLFILLTMPSITFISLLLVNITEDLGFESLLLPLLSKQPWLIIPLLLFFIVAQGPLGEEFGWRGYALEKLFLKWNPFVASNVLGLIWAVWHWPLFYIPGTIQNTIAGQGIILIFLAYIIYTIMLSILTTVVYLKTNRSLFSVLLFHAMANFSHGLFMAITNVLGGVLLLTLMFIITAVMVDRNKKTPIPTRG